MIKPILTAASFTLGGAGVILVGYLSVNPRAFTHPVAGLPFTSPAPPPTRTETPVAVDADQALVLPQVKLVGARRPATKTAQPKLDPCSNWNDVGAMFVEARGATGVRRVRQLCSTPER
jgi:hypothetical protein